MFVFVKFTNVKQCFKKVKYELHAILSVNVNSKDFSLDSLSSRGFLMEFMNGKSPNCLMGGLCTLESHGVIP